MEVKEMLEFYNAPEDVYLEDIVTQNIRETRLVALLIEDGVRTVGDLKKMSDDDLMHLTLFGVKKLDKLREFITDWYEADFPTRVRINVSDASTVIRGLQEDVFLTNKNLEMIALRGSYKTYEEIGEYFGQTRQSIKFTETRIQKEFAWWYYKNRLNDKIGTLDDFVLYCDTNFPEDQRMLKTAVRRLVVMIHRSDEKKQLR